MLFAVALCAAGCAHHHTVQKDISISYDEAKNETERREITTDVRGSTWFSSAQALAKFKAYQTDKTQAVGADSVGQQGATNVVAVLDRVKEIIQATPK